jgi:hypothetical protein
MAHRRPGRSSRIVGCLRVPVISAALACLNTCGCADRYEVDRQASPSGSVDAVVVESNSGATTDFTFSVYLVAAGDTWQEGRRIVRLYGATKSESTYGVNLRWVEPGKLAVEYLGARGTKVDTTSVRIGRKEWEVVLRPGTRETTTQPSIR